jgi:hypothetical protein
MALFLPIAIGARLIEIVEKKKIPYGVPIALAAMFIVIARLVALVTA